MRRQLTKFSFETTFIYDILPLLWEMNQRKNSRTGKKARRPHAGVYFGGCAGDRYSSFGRVAQAFRSNCL